MNRRDGAGICGFCNRSFGTTALFSAYSDALPNGVDVGFHGPMRAAAEKRVLPCACGGQFRGSAVPQCPHCVAELSAEASTDYIERNAEGAASGWRWQRTWQGIYAIVIEDRLVEDPWNPSTAG